MQNSVRERKEKTLDARVVKQEARGKWLEIIGTLAPQLKPAVDKAPRHVGCPVHGGTDGFRFHKDASDTGGAVCNTCGSFTDGLSLLMWFHDWSFPEAIQEVGITLGLDPNEAKKTYIKPLTPHVESEQEKRKREYKDAKCREELKRVWSESVPITAPEAEPVRLYLARRGLKLKYALQCQSLKFHPKMGYFHEGQIIGEYPCMIALAFDADGKPVTIHRTFITDEGFKAPVPMVKKLMPYPSDRKLSGGGIPLMNIDMFKGNLNGLNAIAVTEGIETALAVIEATEGRLPVWPLISDRLMESFVPPSSVDVVCIYGDQDVNEAGRFAATKLKESLQESGVEVLGFLPNKELIQEGEKGIDWLDVLIEHGADFVPQPEGLTSDN